MSKRDRPGQPPRWETPEELQEDIDLYIKTCHEEGRPLTIAGLALAVGVDRQTIYNYEKKDEYFGIIKRARDHILAFLEEKMMMEGKAGQIFLAKNYGYTDRQEIESSGTNSIRVTWGNGTD